MSARGGGRGPGATPVDEGRRQLLRSACLAPVATGGLRAVTGPWVPPAPAQPAAGSGDRGFFDVSPTPDGGYLLVGTRTDASEPATVGWAVKLDGRLDEQWRRRYRSPEHEAARASGDLGEVHDAFAFALPGGDGGALLVGWYHFDDADGRNGWVVGVDGRGRRRWQREYARPGVNTFQNTFADGVRTDDGGALLVGRTLASEATDEVHGDGWAVRVDRRGDVAWERTYNTVGERHDGYDDDPRHDEFEAVVPAGDGGYVLAGEASPDGPSGSTRSAGWLVELDGSGAERWARTYRLTGEADNELLDLVPAADGGYVCCGVAGTDAYERFGPVGVRRTVGRGWVLKVDGRGEVAWERAPGGEGFRAMAPADGGYLLAGSRDGAAWATAVDDAGSVGPAADVAAPPSSRFSGVVPADGGHLLVGWGRSDASGPRDGLVETTGGAGAGGGADGDGPHTLVVTKDDDGKAAYLLEATGAVRAGRDSEAVVEGGSALDHVGRNGTDELRFTGAVATFVMKGRATVRVDGRTVDPGSLGASRGAGDDDDELPNTLTVESGGRDAGNYAVTVDGAIRRGDGSEAAVRGSSAVDWVGRTGGTDTLRYSGSIRTFLLKGHARVYRNGERVDPDDLGG